MSLKKQQHTINSKKYFQGQTILDGQNTTLHELHKFLYLACLTRIKLKPQEVRAILKTLKTGKASGPDGLRYHIFKESSNQH